MKSTQGMKATTGMKSDQAMKDTKGMKSDAGMKGTKGMKSDQGKMSTERGRLGTKPFGCLCNWYGFCTLPQMVGW